MTQPPEPASAPQPIALVGELRPHRRPRPVRVRRPAAISVLVHALVLALLIVGPLLMWPSRKEPEEVLPASVAMVFEPPKDSARSAPEPSPMATLPVPPSPPAPPAPRPAQAQPAPRPAPAPSHPAPAEPPRSAPATTPPAEPSVPPPTKMAALPMPLRPPRVTPQEPAPRPQPRPRPVPRPQSPSDFPAPMNFSLGSPPRAQPRAAQQPTPATYGPAARGPVSFGQFARVTSGKVDPSWLSLLHEWWERHGYYPPQAAANGEDGRVAIQIVVDRYGRVNELELLSRSGSQWLDMAAQGVFRGAKLPPLPPDTTDPQITVELTIDYILYRR